MARPGRSALFPAVLALSFLSLPAILFAQANANVARSRITQPIDETNLVTLKGNTHPLARPEFDRGAAPDSQPMNRALLLLQRSPDQEAALRQLLDEQQTNSSPNFHQWLTPAQFGQQFGPSDADIATVTAWLQSQGFSVNRVSAGRTVIEISGTAGQIRNAFHTEIHKYVVNGESHWANSSDPEIPAALAPVVVGFASLNDFPDQAENHVMGKVLPSHSSDQPQLTAQCQDNSGNVFNCYLVTPYDFATIYNVLPLWTGTGGPVIDGTGQTIAIVAESDICTASSPDFGNTADCDDQDEIQSFRSLFGLSAYGPPVSVILDGPDPGLIDGAATEATLDVEMSGAVARRAQIDLVVAASTDSTGGDRLSAQYIVDNNVAPIMSMSFGDCEASLGTGGNAFFNSLWEQATAEGISVTVATGDSGSDSCDDGASAASSGLSVSGIASTPFNVAIGGTDFNYANNPGTYWNPPSSQSANNPTTEQSVLSYIPEIPWNLSCASAGIGGCASATSNSVVMVGGSGGQSAVYSKPMWQNGSEITGIPATDNTRDIPDVSLFSSIGSSSDTAYVFCESDITIETSGCSLSTGAGLILVGGTSVSSPAFAGVMALVNQAAATQFVPAPRQGNPNYVLYDLAAQEQYSNCNSATVANGNSCKFYDITTGNNSEPCVGGSPNCSSSNTSNYGVLADANGDPAWSATTGYDLATGLGSVNVANFVRNWGSVNRAASTTTLVLNGGNPVNITHGTPVPVSVTVSPSSPQPTGNVSLLASQNNSFQDAGNFTLSNGSATGSTILLPGGTSYNVQANYHGDSHYAGSSSTPVTITVNPESSKTALSSSMFTLNSSTGQLVETPNVTTIQYGSLFALRANVTNSSASSCVNSANSTFAYVCPTGTLNWTQDGSPFGSNPTSLSAQGSAESQSLTAEMNVSVPFAFPAAGNHTYAATYGGDNNYLGSANSIPISVTPAPTTMTAATASNPAFAIIGNPRNFSFLLNAASWAPISNTTFTVFDGSTVVGAHEQIVGSSETFKGQTTFSGTATATLSAPTGPHNLTIQFDGNANYQASVTGPFTVDVLYPDSMDRVSVNPGTVVYGQNTSVTASAILDTTNPASNASLKPQGTIIFQDDNGPLTDPVDVATMPDANGNWELQASTSFVPQETQSIYASYSGDSNYTPNGVTFAGLITVTYPDFSLTPPSSPTPAPAGQTSNMTFTITPMTNYPSTVALTCSTYGQIAATPCNLSSSSVTLSNGAATTATVSIVVPAPSSTLTALTAPAHTRRRFPTSPDRPAWWGLSAVVLMTALLLLLPGRSRSPRIAFGLVSIGFVCFLVGCGGGGTSSFVGGGGGGNGGGGGTGGGGGNGPATTTTTITASAAKTAVGSTLNLTAQVSSQNSLTGLVCFLDSNGGLTNCPNLASGTAQEQIMNMDSGVSLPGTHTYSAQYLGDVNNSQSSSGQVSVVFMGPATFQVCGTTGTTSHCISVPVTIQ